ncbi:hypothetical protein [Aerosakkonema funiforme]|uniref:hypothetical protein n=1 Tax=Aerosakkonema funiforme TaxID=1246630 RepID=UPI0035B9447A
MRLSTLAVCTLAALAAGALSAEANPSQSTHAPPSGAYAAPETVTAPSLAQLVAQIENGSNSQIEVTKQLEAELSSIAQPTNNIIAQSSAAGAKQSEPMELLVTENPGAQALRANNFVSQSSINVDVNQLLSDRQSQNQTNYCGSQTTQNSTAENSTTQVAQGSRNCPRPRRIAPLSVPEVEDEFESSPGLSIYIPVGFGADRNTFFLGGTYQNTTRSDNDDNNGNVGVGIGLGDADRLVGVEISYAFENFNDEDDFGEGGFNLKVHRRLSQSLSVAAGYNGLINIGSNDFEHSRYGVITKIFRTRESVRDPFSRLAVTVGVGDGQFRSNGAIDAGDNDPNFFGNVAFRLIRPISFITEWTGTDLAMGFSIAPFKGIPWVITPAVRDLAGRGDDPRFVVGSGISFHF